MQLKSNFFKYLNLIFFISFLVSFSFLLHANVQANGKEITEIVVMSDLRKNTADTVSTSLQIIDSGSIDRRNAQHLDALLNTAANVNFASGASRGRFIQIRGIGERSQFVEPINPSVGVVLDGIDISGMSGAAMTLDLDRVEILRGPQGTIYGSNALAGLINLRSNRPTSYESGSFAFGVGNYATSMVDGSYSNALASNSNFRIAMKKTNSDGFIKNTHLDRKDTNNINEFSLKSMIDWQMTDKLDINSTLLVVDIDNGYDAFSLDNTRETLSDNPGQDRLEMLALSIETEYRANNFNLLGLISGFDSDTEYGYDEDWAFAEICRGLDCDGWEYSSQDNYFRDKNNLVLDTRLVSNKDFLIAGAESKWVIGFYARLQDEILRREYTYLPEVFISGFDTKNISIYGQLDSDIRENVVLTGGLRLERREASYTDSGDLDHNTRENLWGGKLSLNYLFDNSLTAYILLSKGYKAGGINNNISLPISDRDFDTEYMWNFESGFSGDWFASKLKGKISTFYQWRRDVQLKQSLVIPRDDTNAVEFIDYIGNSAKGINYGMEIDLSLNINNRINLFGSVGLLETEFRIPESESLNLRDQAHAPSYQYMFGADYIFAEYFTLLIDLEGKDKFYLSSSHNEESTAYTLLNAAINYEPTNLKISIWGKNLFNEEVVIRGFGGFGNDPRKYYEVEPYYQLGSPRTYGLTLKYEF